MKKILVALLLLIMIVGCSSKNVDPEVANNNDTKENETQLNNEDNVSNDANANVEEEEEEVNTENNTNENVETEKEKETEETEETNQSETGELKDITLQMTRVDEEAGVNMDEDEVYVWLTQYVEENNKIGSENKFSIFVVNTLIAEDGDKLLLLAINRLEKPVRNASFEYTLGNDAGEFIYEKELVTIMSEQLGDIDVDHAVPFSLEVTSEQIELLDRITDDNLVAEIENLNIDFVE